MFSRNSSSRTRCRRRKPALAQSKKEEGDGFEDIETIDRTIHEPARLRIMALLYVLKSADFLFLQRQTGMTQGNVSSHLNKLEKAGYIVIEKEFLEKRPHTMIRLTEKGRKKFEEYKKTMKQFFEEL